MAVDVLLDSAVESVVLVLADGGLAGLDLNQPVPGVICAGVGVGHAGRLGDGQHHVSGAGRATPYQEPKHHQELEQRRI